jgi:hypothetical protein
MCMRRKFAGNCPTKSQGRFAALLMAYVLRVDSVGTRLGLGWGSVGTRLGLGWDSVGTRLEPGWNPVGTRLGLIKNSLTTRLWSRL